MNWSAELVTLVPLGVVTVTSTVPAELAGEVAVIIVALTTVTPVAAAPPNITAVAPVKLVPVMVTAVPPASGPLVGEMPVTVGGGTIVTVMVRVAVAVPSLTCTAKVSVPL